MQPQKKTVKKMASIAPKKLLDYEARFSELHDMALQLGLSPKELSELTGVKRLQNIGTTKCRLARFFAQLVSLVGRARPLCRYIRLLSALLLLAVIFQWWNFGLHTQKGWVSLLIEREKLETEPCVVDMPARLQNGMMPPVDCEICKDLTRVSRRSSLSHLDFESKHAYSGVPVVVTDGASNWTALESFSLHFFKDVYQNTASRASRSACQFFPYKTEFKSLEEVFNMTVERSQLPWYIGWSNCNPSVASILRTHYRTPYFLPPHSEGSTLDWIFMGSPGYGAHLHIDHVGKPSWQAQIKGKKLWTLKPVPECYTTCHELQVVVHPGEIFVVDSNLWYHKTEIVSNEISIAIGSEYD